MSSRQDEERVYMLSELGRMAQQRRMSHVEIPTSDALELSGAFKRLADRERMRDMEVAHLRKMHGRMIGVLAAISMRCAPDDVITPDGKCRRFVPPDPEMYWRELSSKVRAVKEEIHAIHAADDAAEIERMKGA